MRIVLFVILIGISFLTYSQENNQKEGTYSEYKDGRYFHTYSACLVNAPFFVTKSVLDEVFEGMKSAPTQKLKWAFKGLGDVGAKEDILMYEKGVFYNPKDSEYLLNLLIILKNEKEMDVEVAGELRNVSYMSGRKEVSLNVTKKIKILNDGLICISAIPQTDDSSLIIIHSKLRFGWIFDIFFTQKRYKSILEWRFAGFLKNVQKRIEERTIQ